MQLNDDQNRIISFMTDMREVFGDIEFQVNTAWGVRLTSKNWEEKKLTSYEKFQKSKGKLVHEKK